MKGRIVKLSVKEQILEVLGWIGLVAMLLTVVVVIGTIVTAILLDWEYGISLLLYGIILGSVGVTGSYLIYRIILFRKQDLFPPNFIRCHYCGMKNFTNAQFCIRCGKVLPRKQLYKMSRL